MKKIIFILFLIPLLLTLVSSKVQAVVIDKKYDRTYEVIDDSVKVNEVKTFNITNPNWYIPAGSEEVFIIFNPVENDPKQQEKIDKTLSSISIIDSQGLKLNYTSEKTSNNNLLIKVRTPRNIRFGDNYKIELNYTSFGLIIKSGAIRDLYIPAFSKDYKFESENSRETISTRAKIPVEYGELNFVVPQTGIKRDGNFWILDFEQSKLIGETGWIQIGKSQYYTFKVKQSYQASTQLPFTFNTYRIILPRDIISGNIAQKIYFTNLTPEPTHIEEDKDGNLIAVYKVPGVESGEINIEGYGILEQNQSVDFSKSTNISDIPRSIIETNTTSAKYWESGSIEIQQAAKEIKGSETNVYELVKKTYQYVVDKIDYSDIKRFGINNRQGALATLRGGAAVCMEYSDLFIALMRAQGIPARGAFGHGYSALEYYSTQENTINHQWAEVFIPGVNRWVPVDTTWGENGRTLIGGDLNHFYSHVASVSPESPSTTEVVFYGSVAEIPQRETKIDTVDKGDIENEKGLTQQDLLQKYQKADAGSEIIGNFTGSANLAISYVGAKFDALLANFIQDQQLRNLIKSSTFGLIILIPVVVIARKAIRKKANLMPQ